jgi:hypothetical protein
MTTSSVLAGHDSLIQKISHLCQLSIGPDEGTSEDLQQSVARLEQQLRFSALSINVSGRLRMLLQKSCKEYFMILSGFSVTETRRQLKKSQLSFENSLAILTRNTEKGIFSTSENKAILSKISEIQNHWNVLKEHLNLANQDEALEPKTTKFIAKNNPELLERIEGLVSLFENIAYHLHEN